MPREEEASVIVGSDGFPKDEEDGGNGIILRGEDAEKYLAGENVPLSGVGIVNINDGVVEPFIGDPNTAPDSPQAASATALRKGDVTQEEFDTVHGASEASADEDADSSDDEDAQPKGRRGTRNKAATEEPEETPAED